ncbi:MAG: hypothetical protein ACYC2H_09030 [Thermoplasmatota archaeon]
MAFAVRKSVPTRDIRPPSLRVDPAKYPNLAINPSLERALRIRQELEKGRPREEAVALADAAMGRSKRPSPSRPKARRSAKVAGRAKAHAAKRSR